MNEEFINNPVAAYEKLMDDYAELKTENEVLKKNVEVFQNYITQNEQLKTEIGYLVRKNKKLKAEKERLKRENEIITGMHKSLNNRFDKLYNTLQEIKTIAKTDSPYIDNFEIKTATEIEYDYAAICNELELRLHKILELITKAEEE